MRREVGEHAASRGEVRTGPLAGELLGKRARREALGRGARDRELREACTQRSNERFAVPLRHHAFARRDALEGAVDALPANSE